MTAQEKRVAVRIGNYRFALDPKDWRTMKRVVDQALAQPNKSVKRAGNAGLLGAIAFDVAKEKK